MDKPSFTAERAVLAIPRLRNSAINAEMAYAKTSYGNDVGADAYLARCEGELREAAKILGFRLEPINAPKQEVK